MSITLGDMAMRLSADSKAGDKSRYTKHLTSCLTKLQELTGCDVLMYYSGYIELSDGNDASFTMVPEDVDALSKLCENLEKDRIILILHSPGGSLDVVKALVEMLRKRSYFGIAIPYMIQTTATMMICAADEIFMTDHSFVCPADQHYTLPTPQDRHSFPGQIILKRFENNLNFLSKDELAKMRDCDLEFHRHVMGTTAAGVDFMRDSLQASGHGKNMSGNEIDRLVRWLTDYDVHMSYDRPLSYRQLMDMGLAIKHLDSRTDKTKYIMEAYYTATLAVGNTSSTKMFGTQYHAEIFPALSRYPSVNHNQKEQQSVGKGNPAAVHTEIASVNSELAKKDQAVLFGDDATVIDMKWRPLQEPVSTSMERVIPNALTRIQRLYSNARQKYLHEISCCTNRDVLLYYSGIDVKGKNDFTSIGHGDLESIVDVCSELDGDELDIIIHSPGGWLSPTEQIIAFLRIRYKKIRVFIPHKAMSCATVWACAADEIILFQEAHLHPTDPQIPNPFCSDPANLPASAVIDIFEQDVAKVAGCGKVNYLNEFGDHHVFAKLQNNLTTEVMSHLLMQYSMSPEHRNEEMAFQTAEWFRDIGVKHGHTYAIPLNELKSRGISVGQLDASSKLHRLILTLCEVTRNEMSSTFATKIINSNKGKNVVSQLPEKAREVVLSEMAKHQINTVLLAKKYTSSQFRAKVISLGEKCPPNITMKAENIGDATLCTFDTRQLNVRNGWVYAPCVQYDGSSSGSETLVRFGIIVHHELSTRVRVFEDVEINHLRHPDTPQRREAVEKRYKQMINETKQYGIKSRYSDKRNRLRKAIFEAFDKYNTFDWRFIDDIQFTDNTAGTKTLKFRSILLSQNGSEYIEL